MGNAMKVTLVVAIMLVIIGSAAATFVIDRGLERRIAGIEERVALVETRKQQATQEYLALQEAQRQEKLAGGIQDQQAYISDLKTKEQALAAQEQARIEAARQAQLEAQKQAQLEQARIDAQRQAELAAKLQRQRTTRAS